MEISRRICLYGNSVILGTLGVTLNNCAQFEVKILTPPLPQTQELAAINPDVVIFDLDSFNNQAVFPLLAINPKLLLLGISPDTNLVKMWAGQQLQELSTQGLMDIIDEQVKVKNKKVG